MFRTTLWFVLAPLLAWSAPWTCSPIVTPVGPIPTSSGGLTQVDAGVVLVYSPVPGAGFPGLMAGPTGGITVGSGAAFNSDFVYNANHSDGTISRILIPPGGVSPPYEEARYFGIVPVNNHFHTYNAALGQGSNWSAAGVDQLDPTQSPNLWVAPSRSVVDRNGNAWVTLRASNWSIDWQAGVTKIINVDDNATNPSPELGCVPRCHHRQNLATDTIFTEGLPMSLASGGAVILSPVARPGTTVVTGPPGTTGGVIIPGSSAAQAYVCLDSGLHNYLDENDPTNYDDCVRYSIALGDPQPDLEADALGQTSGAHLGRGTALAPNCDPTNTNKECDLWLDLYNGNAALVHLSFDGTNAKPQPLNPTWTSAPYDVSVVHHPGAPGYGLTVDCAGIVWTSKAGIGEVTGTTSVPINDFIVTGGGVVVPVHIPADTVITDVLTSGGTQHGIPNTLNCGPYGVASDAKESLWFGSYNNNPPGTTRGRTICAFDARSLLTTYPLWKNSVGLGATPINPVDLVSLNAATQAAWRYYDFSTYPLPGMPPASSYVGIGVAVSRASDVYMGLEVQTHAGGPGTTIYPNANGVLSFDPYATSPSSPAPCHDGAGGTCAPGQLNWISIDPTGASGTVTIGVDLDAEDQVWSNVNGGIAAGFPGAGFGADVRRDHVTGALLSTVPVGHGPYSYSDFTGYAMRYITLLRTPYAKVFPGCGVSPELTQWNNVTFTADTPPGTDLAFDVSVSNDPSVPGTTIHVCPSIEVGGGCACPAPAAVPAHPGTTLDISACNVPQGRYLTVSTTLSPRICSANGGSNPLAKPVLYNLFVGSTCAGD